MVTFAQAQERAERWVNGAGADDPAHEVRVREFNLGFVAWAEDASGGEVGGGRLVIARDSGETTYWPRLPVSEVIRHFEEEYGRTSASVPAPEPPKSVDLEATSFLLTPPQWLQEAADKAGIPDNRPGAAASPASSSTPPSATPSATPSPAPSPPGLPVPPKAGSERPSAPDPFAPPAPAKAEPAKAEPAKAEPTKPEPARAGSTPDPFAPPKPSGPAADSPWAAADVTPGSGNRPAGGASPWAGTDTSGSAEEAEAMAPPATVFSPPLLEDDDRPSPSRAPASEARTTVMPQGSALPATAVQPPIDGG
ncbi:hypothetical protein EBN88_26725, partial [Streptomyces triticirhizae]